MLTGGGWEIALVAVGAAHAGFQLTISCLVYPALFEVPADSWTTAHARHSRRIIPLVGVVYLAVVGASVGVLLSDPAAPAVLAVGASAAVLGVTALVAAPLHRRLAAPATPALIRRLLWADWTRTAFALLALAAAGWNLRR